jgi:hypothetical protein
MHTRPQGRTWREERGDPLGRDGEIARPVVEAGQQPDVGLPRRATLRQKRLSRSSRSPGLFPAIIAPLIAPIDVPMTESGSICASCSAS